jgi:hypothetical protein
LAFLRAVDAAETDTLRVGVVQDFDGVAVEDGDDGAGEVSCSFHGRNLPVLQHLQSRQGGREVGVRAEKWNLLRLADYFFSQAHHPERGYRTNGSRPIPPTRRAYLA